MIKELNLDFGRRTGRTTRLADKCIQEYFKLGFCICRDHFVSRVANENLFSIVWARLNREHKLSTREIVSNTFYSIIAINKETLNKVLQKLKDERIK